MEMSATMGERLLSRARRGSESALGQLMVSYRPWLRERVRGRLPRELERKQDASDLVQECQYLAAARIGEFRGGSLGEFRAWLAGILDRRLLRALRFWGERRRDRRRERPLAATSGSEEAIAREPAGAESSVLGRIERHEQCERLRQAMSWCRPEDQEILARHLFEGRGHDQIADELGITAAAARQRFCRAVRRAGEAMHLLDQMSRRGWGALRQDVVGLHRLQGAGAAEIAGRLGVPEGLVGRWIDQAGPLLRASSSEGRPS